MSLARAKSVTELQTTNSADNLENDLKLANKLLENVYLRCKSSPRNVGVLI